jgi:hypothetical protein
MSALAKYLNIFIRAIIRNHGFFSPFNVLNRPRFKKTFIEFLSSGPHFVANSIKDIRILKKGSEYGQFASVKS